MEEEEAFLYYVVIAKFSGLGFFPLGTFPHLSWRKFISHVAWSTQREGMGLLEYQALPTLRDVAHDGWLCTFTM